MPNGSKRSTIAVSFLTLYSHHPLDSRQISSKHSDTRARLNLIKSDKFSNFGRAASILIRAMNINGRQLRHNSITFSNILAPLVSFFFLPQPKIKFARSCQFLARVLVSFRFVSYTRISILRQLEEDENSIQALLFIPLSSSFSFSSPIEFVNFR